MRKWPDLIFAGDRSRASLSQAARAGSIRRLARGIYTGIRIGPPAQVARRYWREILAHELPGAILADRSARMTRPDDAGRLFVVHTRQRPLILPGLTIIPRPGTTGVEGDTELDDGTFLSSAARGLLDNLAGRGERYLTTDEVERWIADMLVATGVERLNATRDHARRVAPKLGRARTFSKLDRLISASLSSGTADALSAAALQARAAGAPYDHRRVELFTGLADALRDLSPAVLADLPREAGRRRLLPFYEAYFSNFIEGTEFTLDEAARIALDGIMPADRPADAHDLAGTYQVTADAAEMACVPRAPDELLDILADRHRVVMAGRPEQRPGRFKLDPNRAGATYFVAPELVQETLRVGFECGAGLVSPFQRAVYMMVLVSEVHPFADGNGRVARLMMNSELVAQGEVRIITPTVYRNDYLAALRGATHNGNFAGLAATLDFARRYTARIDFSDRTTAEADLERTNALISPTEADESGIRLIMP